MLYILDNKISIQLSKNELINPENNENSMNNSESHINIGMCLYI